MKIFSCIGLLVLAGCAVGNPRATAVSALAARDVSTIAGGIERFVSVTLPVAGTPLALESTEAMVAPALRSGLIANGYRLVARGEVGAHTVGYRVDAMSDYVLLRVFIDNTTGSRLYRHDDQGFLHAAGPYTALVETSDSGA